ncbi:GrBNV gp83-like protein [Tomelloso virus]|uniref:GrBNV gp83-like protein n=1 Tax=Tomelloso virus TaxID=2053981 RepID=A0A2H4T2Q0_9VIRU|nr:GrBNV gp83-like protein [Tomelloso virus]ATY70196.1 GrBNV gp83-like protein [Tomelloso virus]
MEFYAQLRKSMVEMGQNGLKVTKLPTVENSDEILSQINKSTESGKEKERLVVGVYVLASIYKNKLVAARSKKERNFAKQSAASHSVKSNGIEKTKNQRAKIDKLDCLSDVILESTSVQLKMAVAFFLSTKLADNVKLSLISAIVNDSDQSRTCEYISNLFLDPQQAIAKVREYIDKSDRSALSKSTEKYILCALIELSDLFRDKTYSKLAMDINSQRYIDLSTRYLSNGLIHTIAPFEPAIASFIKNSIALCSQEDERKIIHNQYRTSPVETINAVISGLPDPKKRNISRVSDKSRIFSADETYQCHKGPVGYTRDIVATYYKSGQKLYKILTYSDCLYDVIGCTTETVDSKGETVRIDELFDRIPWMDRLRLLPEFRAKVVINSTTGAELNSYTGDSSDIAVSWMNDEGYSCSKTYIMKKPKDPKIKVEETDGNDE